jgi:ubiquinone/menaquinone biosynthesis C-methylase UbiE
MMLQPTESWGSAHAYERFMGRWSKLVAEQFLRWLPIAAHKRWLDVGCGTGVLSHSILRAKAPAEILAIDSSPAFVAFGRETNQDTRLYFEVGQAEFLPVESNTFDVAVSSLVINFVSQPGEAMAEMVRATKPGGFVATYVWDYTDGMQMLRTFWDAVAALDANVAELQRLALRQRLQATLPQTADGTITLTARAWAARGMV